MELTESIKHILNGEAVLFLGAGFSKGAKDKYGNDFKDAKTLATSLLQKVGVDQSADLDFAAQHFISEQGTGELFKFLEENLTCESVEDYHNTILSLPWKMIYTTNFDNVIDYVGKARGITFHHYTVDQDPINFPKAGTVCYYINGRLQAAEPEDLLDKIKLTSRSYDTAGFTDSMWAGQFRSDIRSAKTVLFLGYSLYDLEISKILYEYENLREKTFFVTSPRPDIVRDSNLKPYGTVESIGVDKFAKEVDTIKVHYEPRKLDHYEFVSFDKLIIPRPEKLSIDVVDKLLLYGQVSMGTLASSISDSDDNPIKYYIERESLNRSTEILLDENSEIRNLIVHSGLANGKTLYTLGLGTKLMEAGFDVFFLKNIEENIEREIELLCETTVKTLIVIENYNMYKSVLEQIKRARTDKIYLCLTLRSTLHLLDFNFLHELFDEKEYWEVDIDRLEDPEIEDLVKLCNQSALWGSRTGETDYKKKLEIKDNCNAQFQPFLLSILKSPDVETRVSDLMSDISKDKNLRNLVITILIIEVLQLNANFDVIAELVGVNQGSFNKLKSTPFANEFLNFESGEIRPRSSLVAQYLIQEKFESTHVLDVLKLCAKKCHQYWQSKPEGIRRNSLFMNLWKSIMKYGQLNLIIPKKGKRKAVNDFYESIRNLSSVTREPQYWLQNAIARLAFNDFGPAERFFDTAYDLANKRRNYNSSFIDNSYSRFLLQRIIHEDRKESFSEFKNANNILNSQLRTPVDMNYPIKVIADQYGEVLSRVFPKWNLDQKREFKRDCRHLWKLSRNRVRKNPDNKLNQKLNVNLSKILENIEHNWGGL